MGEFAVKAGRNELKRRGDGFLASWLWYQPSRREPSGSPLGAGFASGRRIGRGSDPERSFVASSDSHSVVHP